jgi:hypothetical protein
VDKVFEYPLMKLMKDLWHHGSMDIGIREIRSEWGVNTARDFSLHAFVVKLSGRV